MAALLLGLASAVGSARAAVGDLQPIPGPSGCVSVGPLRGCVVMRGVRGPYIKDFNPDTTLSSDGRNVYFVVPHGIAVFRRSARGLRQLRGSSGCLTAAPVHGCTHIRGARKNGDVVGLSLSSDGRLAVASVVSPGLLLSAPNYGLVAAFARNPANGALEQLAGQGGCVRSKPLAGCGVEPRLGGAPNAQLAPDGAHVFVTSENEYGGVWPHDARVLAMTLSTAAGLRPIPGQSSCLSEAPVAGCTAVDVLLGGALAVAPSGDRLLAIVREAPCPPSDPDADEFCSAYLDLVQAIAVDPAGSLSLVPRPLGCLSNKTTGCTRVRGMFMPGDLVFAPNGHTAYVGDGYALMTFSVKNGSTLQQLPGKAGCLQTRDADRDSSCGVIRWLTQGSGPTVSPDGRNVYLVDGSAVAVFSRNRATGRVHQHTGPGSCMTGERLKGCQHTRFSHVGGAYAVHVSPDGKRVYADGYERVLIFRRLTR